MNPSRSYAWKTAKQVVISASATTAIPRSNTTVLVSDSNPTRAWSPIASASAGIESASWSDSVLTKYSSKRR
jgi:hypothetical protein